MSKTIVVFGASGTIGQGFIKIALEKSGIKVVGVFRSEESAKKVLSRLGSPSGDKFVPIIGNVASEQDAADLQKKILAKVGTITDVVSTIGAFAFLGSLIELSVEELREEVFDNKIAPHFLVAKYFLPLVQDKEGTSFTIINGGAAYQPAPRFGHMTIANGALLKLAQVLAAEHKDKPVRINEFVICSYVAPWDNLTVPPDYAIFPHTDNLAMGKALLGVIVHPNAKGESISVLPDSLKKLAESGAL